MRAAKRSNFRPGLWCWILSLGLGFSLLWLYRVEIGRVLSLWQPAWVVLRGGRAPFSLTPEITLAALTLLLACVPGLLLFVVNLWLISHLVLPVESPTKRGLAFKRFLLHIFHLHGLMALVRNGKAPAQALEKSSSLPGVAVVDYNSAVVIEKEPVDSLWKKFIHFLVESLLNERAAASRPRIAGQGIVFIRPGEKIRGAVDLRPQVRSQPDVLASTSDGIEVKSKVYAEFTLGQPSEVLLVTYAGDEEGKIEEKAENLRVIKLKAAPQTPSESHQDFHAEAGSIFYLEAERQQLKIAEFSDDLDPPDKEEIDRYVKRHRRSMMAQIGQKDHGPGWKRYEPQRLFERRLEAAVYSQARDARSGVLGDWADLALKTVVDVFRDTISRYSYDDLFLPENLAEFPVLEKIKPGFNRAIRNLGVLSYRFVWRKDGKPLRIGDVWDERRLYLSAPRNLQTPKLLRERGIKVIGAGFSEIKPASEAVRQQRLDYWRARWQREIDAARADRDLEVTRIRNRARAETLSQMTYTLSQILQKSQYSKQAMAVRLFQALERVAADPATRRLLPRETIGMLRSLGHWLMIDRGEGLLFYEKPPLTDEEAPDEGPFVETD